MIGISRAMIDRLARVPGTRAALIVEAEAGVPIAAELSEGVNGTAVAALAAAVFRRCAEALAAGALGEPATLQLEAEGGHVVVAGRGEMLVVALTAPDAHIGLVRLEALRVLEQIA